MAWPYREYSEVFFGADYKVLRGGSFAVDPVACRGTFRNWDYPIRRQIFAGFRTARDGEAPLRGARAMPVHVDGHLPPDFAAYALREDASAGLTATPKSLPPKWFYDKPAARCSRRSPSCRSTTRPGPSGRSSARRAGADRAASRARHLVELGSGSSDKTRLLLDAMRAAGTLRRYVPVDVSEAALADAGRGWSRDYPGLRPRHGRGLRAPPRVASGDGNRPG